MRSFLLGFVTGTACLQTAATLPSTHQMAACAALAALLLLACAHGRAIRHAAARISTIATAGLLAGVAWAALLAHTTLAAALDPRDEGRDLRIVGIVETLPYRFEQGVRFDFHVERTLDAGVRVPPHVALSWYAGPHGARQVVGDVQPGQRWQLTVRLQRPHGNANPGVWASCRLKTLLSKLQKWTALPYPWGNVLFNRLRYWRKVHKVFMT